MESACSRSPDVLAWRWTESAPPPVISASTLEPICGKAAGADARSYQPTLIGAGDVPALDHSPPAATERAPQVIVGLVLP